MAYLRKVLEHAKSVIILQNIHHIMHTLQSQFHSLHSHTPNSRTLNSAMNKQLIEDTGLEILESAGDDVANVGDLYGVEFEGPIPPVEVQDDATTFVNTDEEIEEVWKKMEGFDLLEDDENWGIEVFCRAVIHLTSHM